MGIGWSIGGKTKANHREHRGERENTEGFEAVRKVEARR
jgi:hypothetical protein